MSASSEIEQGQDGARAPTLTTAEVEDRLREAERCLDAAYDEDAPRAAVASLRVIVEQWREELRLRSSPALSEGLPHAV